MVRARAPYALARAVAATTVAVTGATTAHTWAGGDVPTGPGLTLVAAVVLGASVLVFRRDVPGWALLPAVAAAQLGVHESFGLVPSHDHAAAAAPDPGWSWQMVGAHAFVTLLTAVLWWAGRLAASYAVSVHAHPAVPVRTHVPRRPSGATRSSLVLLLVSPRRGPPLAVLSA